MSFRHGIRIVEYLRGPRPFRDVETAVVFLVGTAPLMSVAQADRTVNALVAVRNDLDLVKSFGPAKAGYTLPGNIELFQKISGGATVIAVNVLDPAKAAHKQSALAEEKAFGEDDALTLAGDEIFNVVVKNQAETVTYVLGTDYAYEQGTAASPNAVVRRIAGGAIPSEATVRVSYDKLKPSGVVAADVVGTVVAGVRTGLQLWREIRNAFGFRPGQIVCPGFSTAAAVAAEMRAIAPKLRATAYFDAPAGQTVSGAIAARGTAGDPFNTSDDRAVLLFPMPKVGTEVAAFSTVAAGLQAKIDRDEGFWFSLSNHEIPIVTGAERLITWDAIEPEGTEANDLNAAGIVTLVSGFGTGIRAWGNSTAAFPTETHPGKRFLAVRRVADTVWKTLEEAWLPWIDKPVTPGLLDEILAAGNRYVGRLIGKGALVRGSRVEFDAAKNTAEELAAGRLHFDFILMAPTPAEETVIHGYIDSALLRNILPAAA